MTAHDAFALIQEEPIATIRKFKLMKVFHALLPPEAKTWSADGVAAFIRTRLKAADFWAHDYTTPYVD